MRGKLPHHIPSTSGLSWQKMWHFNKIPTPNRLGIIQMHHLHPVFTNKAKKKKKKKKLGGTLPLTREENNPLFILGEHTLALYISSGSSQNSHTIFEKILKSNRQKSSECTICIIFLKKILGETTTPPPFCKRIKKTPLLDFILCSTAKVKIVPHHGYRRSEIWRQNYTTFLGRNQHELCKKKMGIEYTICIQFSKKKSFGDTESLTLLHEDKKCPIGLYMIL